MRSARHQPPKGGLARGAGADRAFHLDPIRARPGESARFKSAGSLGSVTWGCYDADRVRKEPIPDNRWQSRYVYFNEVGDISPDGVFTAKRPGEAVVLSSLSRPRPLSRPSSCKNLHIIRFCPANSCMTTKIRVALALAGHSGIIGLVIAKRRNAMKASRFLVAALLFAAVRSLAGVDSWTALQAALNAGGTVTLTENLAASGGDAPLVVRKTVTLDLAGHAISGNGKDPVVSVAGGGNLTLTNSMDAAGAITGGGRGVTVNGGGVFTMNGGTIANNTDGGVFVTCDEENLIPGSFTMNGGKIVGNSAIHGGGVFVFDSEFAMNGGVVAGNTATDCGGGVMKSGGGSFEMNGGTISGNAARSGGGVCVTHSVLVTGGISIRFPPNVFAMSGGEISGNCAEEAGGAVFLDWLGAMIVRGTPVVSGNTNSVGAANNVHLNKTWVEIQDLSAGASIGVTTAAAPTASAPVTFTELASASDASFFFSDNPRYSVGTDEYGESCLVADMAFPEYLDGADDSVKTNWVNWATRHGAVMNDACEAAFLLDLAPADLAACTGALLRVGSFVPTATGLRLELASDVATLVQPAGREGSSYLCNGIAVLEVASDLASMTNAPANLRAVPATIEGGRAVFDFPASNASALFFRPSIRSVVPEP